MKGRILAGKYRLVEELGRGGMGSVWRADHVELRSSVAVKLIDPALAETREGQSRFLREARAAGGLRSTHVVSVFDYGVDDGTPFLVMELLEGESLAQRLEKRGRLELSEVQAIMKQVARGLVKAHSAGIVHRDLKPENIFITNEGDTEVVKVLDFGIAKVGANMAVSVQTQTGMVLGTPYYMSPEQAEGRRELDARSDVWSLGVIVYECLLGRKPFDGDNLAQIILAICADPMPVPSRVGTVPHGFDHWFAHVVCRGIELRCATIQLFAEELARLGELPAVRAATPDGDRRAAVSEHVEAPALSDSAEIPPAPVIGVPPTSRAAGIVVATLVVVVAVLFGVGGWYWSGGAGTTTPEAAAHTNGTGSAAPEVGADRQPPAEVHSVETSPPMGSSVSIAPATSLLAVRPPVTAHPPASTPPALSGTKPGAVSVALAPAAPAVSPKPALADRRPQEPPKPNSTNALFCSYNSISGRLVRSSPGKAGSFPCYVNTLSGELRKKD